MERFLAIYQINFANRMMKIVSKRFQLKKKFEVQVAYWSTKVNRVSNLTTTIKVLIIKRIESHFRLVFVFHYLRLFEVSLIVFDL